MTLNAVSETEMLDPKKNRLDYGTLLMPPDRYELTHAVATTYSLDLFTLLAIPVALFYSKVLDGRFEDDRFDVLESIQKTAGILSIYCQKGKIKVPRKFNWLFAYLEDAICEIVPKDHVSSFHPKIWLLRFHKAQQVIYRLIVLSRNLTFDRSWDLAMQVDGVLAKQVHTSNLPLVDFLRYLFKVRRPAGANTILNELGYVNFETPEGFKRLTLHPIGIDGYQTYKNPLSGRPFDKLLIVSPFVDRTTLKKLHQNCPSSKTLISREEELQKIPHEVLDGFQSYFLSRRIVDGENFEDSDESDLEPKQQQLHAKLFVGEHRGRTHWFLGSANCTDPAFTRNIEFMVGLEGENKTVGSEAALWALLNAKGDSVIFEPYEPVNENKDAEAENIRQLIRRLEYDLVNASLTGKVLARKNTQNFDLHLLMDTRNTSWEKEITVRLAPLNAAKNSRIIRPGALDELLFENLSEVDLSIFAVINIFHKGVLAASFIVKMQVVFPETRKDKILKNLIASSEAFYKYLNFIISDNPYLADTIIKNSNGNLDPHQASYGQSFAELPIFEHLLMTASRAPSKLKSIDRLIQRLKDEDGNEADRIIPEEFIALWNEFRQLAGIK